VRMVRNRMNRKGLAVLIAACLLTLSMLGVHIYDHYEREDAAETVREWEMYARYWETRAKSTGTALWIYVDYSERLERALNLCNKAVSGQLQISFKEVDTK